MLALGSGAAQAQTDGKNIMPSPMSSIDCFPGQSHNAERPIYPNPSSTFGATLTGRGNLKVLVLFAGYTEEADLNCSTYDAQPWPNTSPNPSMVGHTFPANLSSFFYTSPTQFSPTATDPSFSNFFYQMSRTAANPFRMTFGFLPARVNVSYAAYPNLGSATNAVINLAIAQNPNFDWASYDQRTNRPDFRYDNSNSTPDGKLDYVVVCWRTFRSCGVGQGPGAGYAGTPYIGNVVPANANHPQFTFTDGHVQTGGGIDRGVFLHEFAHNLYNAPHMAGANGAFGEHFDVTNGWGMMSGFATYYSCNAWERWYNGWTELKTGSTQVSSDIVDATSLTATNGVYTLRDFVRTGDVMRIKIPNANQYLWLENRAGNGTFDNRQAYITAGDNLPFAAPPTGLVGMVEDLAIRSAPLTYVDIFSSSKVNRLRTLSAQGNYDYQPLGPPSAYNNHFFGNLLYNFAATGNAAAGVNQISGVRFDLDGNNVINYDPGSGNNDMTTGNEAALQLVLNGNFTDGLFGPNIGTRTVGFRYGLDTNPMLTANPYYNSTTQSLSELPLSGLSVQVTGYDAATGDLTVKVRFNDTALRQATTRWTGQLRTYPVANATNNAAIWVNNGLRLSLERSATPQRSTKSAQGDFVNDTRLTISSTTKLLLESAANLDLRGSGTTLYVEPNASVYIGGGGKLTAYAGTTISLNNRADLAGTGELKAGAQLVVRSTGQTINGPATW